MSGPVFIGGAARSGKTLMRWVIASHPRIAVSRRTDMWPRFHGRFGDLSERENFDRCVAAMLRRKQIAALGVDASTLRPEFERGPMTYARLFALLHERFAARLGKPRWGDQTASIDRFADLVIDAYPDARVIHMIRDPRDRHEAMVQRRQRAARTVGRSTASWLDSAALAERNRAAHPDAYHVIRYEDLATAPEDTIRRVCDHIEEVFDPSMLRLPGASRYDRDRAASPVGIPISAAFVGGYRRSIAPGELAFIQGRAGARMKEFGYALDPVRWTAVGRARYVAIGWPAAATAMRSARILDHVRHRADAPTDDLARSA